MGELLKDDLREIKDGTVYNRQTEFPFEIYGETGIGGRKENQDSFWFGDTSYGLLMIVCDGMGGGPGGHTASSLAVQEIGNYIKQQSNREPLNVIKEAVLTANKSIFTFAKQHPELIGMGSTCVVALMTREKALVCHIGDSRFYQIRKHKEIFHTFDHSQVFEMVKNGIISEEEARVSPISNVITKALGLNLDLEIEEKSDLSSDILELPYQIGDRFVLCTDGIHGVLPNSDLVKELTGLETIESSVESLYSKINQLGVDSGNQHDNLTLLMAVAKSNSLMPDKQRPPKFIPTKSNINFKLKLSKYYWFGIFMLILLMIFIFIIIPDKRENPSKTPIVINSDTDSINTPIVQDSKINKEDQKDYGDVLKDKHAHPEKELSLPSKPSFETGKHKKIKAEEKTIQIQPKNPQTSGGNKEKKILEIP